MLMFIFGAGASFDSDPERRSSADSVHNYDFRPPLAPGLFSPNNYVGKEVIGKFPRAASLLMRLRHATRQGQHVEEVLEQIAAGIESYSATAVQLLAFRAYLAKLLDDVPAKWLDECQGLTNYVSLLEQADRWNTVVHADSSEAIACVTFNYDAMLERAVGSVFGHALTHIDRYTTDNRIHIYKPHGSVNWRQSAGWDQPENNWLASHGGLTKAIDQAASLDWKDEFRYQVNDDYQDRDDATKVWLPALSIPVRRKATFTMPKTHQSALLDDLPRVTTVVAVGWRARERHFLQLLQDHLGSGLARLVAVAENDERAKETIDNLWEIGRFDRYAISGIGFSGFTDRPTDPYAPPRDPEGHTGLTLHHVLTSGAATGTGVWTTCSPGYGLTRPADEIGPLDAGYLDL